MATKRGRKTAADLTVVQLTGQRLTPPDHLNDAEVAEWRAIVDSLPADYFRPGDVPLLAAYCTASAFYKQAKEELRTDGLTIMDDKGRTYANPAHQILTSQASAMAQMAVKLRLCPSARYTEKSAGTKAKGAATGGRPWEAEAGS